MANNKETNNKNNATKRGEIVMTINETKNKMKKVAAIAIAILAICSIIAATIMTSMVPSVGDHFNNTATYHAVTTNTETTKEIKEVVKIADIEVTALMDRSGSMNGWTVATPSADKTVDIEGSKIQEGIKAQLDAGVQRMIVVTDCESYPAEDWDVLDGTHYENAEIIFYVPETASDVDVQAYKTIFSKILNTKNSTLAFYSESGKDVVFNNFVPTGDDSSATTTTTTKVTESPIDVEVVTDYTAGNSIPWTALIWIIEGFIILCSIFAEVILAIAGDTYVNIVEAKEKDDDDDEPVEPVGVKEAVKADEVLLDGSGSVEHEYRKFIEYCNKYNVAEVVRFAGNVGRMALAEAEKIPASGGTSGWSAIKNAIDDNRKVITIVSDFDFNDKALECTQYDQFFDEVFWVHGASYNQGVVDQIKTIAKKFTEVDLTAALAESNEGN